MFYRIFSFIIYLFIFTACTEDGPTTKKTINEKVTFLTSANIDIYNYFPSQNSVFECTKTWSYNDWVEDENGSGSYQDIIEQETVFYNYEMVDNGFILTTTSTDIDFSSYVNTEHDMEYTNYDVISNGISYIFKNDRILMNGHQMARHVDSDSYIYDYYYSYDDGEQFGDYTKVTRYCQTTNLDKTTNELSIECIGKNKFVHGSYDFGYEELDVTEVQFKLTLNKGFTYTSYTTQYEVNIDINCSN